MRSGIEGALTVPVLNTMSLRYTRSGSLAVVWSLYKGKPKILRVFLSDPKGSAKPKMEKFFPDAKAGSHRRIDALIKRMIQFMNGADIRFPLTAVRLDLCSAFQQKVLRAKYTIPRGRLSTYRLIARRIGRPRAARAVGTALAKNPFPIIIPCHRAIRSDGALGGYQGGPKMKQTLLAMEWWKMGKKKKGSGQDIRHFSPSIIHFPHGSLKSSL